MAQTKRPQPPALERDGFTLKGDKFGIKDVSTKGLECFYRPIEGRKLLDYFFPTSTKHGEAQRLAKVEAGYLFSKDFFAAQLRYYGLEFPARASKAELGKILKKAVVGGKVSLALSSPRGCYWY